LIYFLSKLKRYCSISHIKIDSGPDLVGAPQFTDLALDELEIDFGRIFTKECIALSPKP
jgi:hypothetical protein